MPSSCCQLMKHSDKADFWKRPLSIVFEWSRQLGEVPEAWKKGSVTPVFQKGTKEDLGNSRLVCLTSVPGKGKEPLILETLSRHMTTKDVIVFFFITLYSELISVTLCSPFFVGGCVCLCT